MNTVYSYTYYSFGFGVLLIGFAALLKRRDVIGARFFSFSLAVVGWATGMSLWITQEYSYEETLFLTRLSNGFATLIPLTWLRFVFALTGTKEKLIHKVVFALLAVFSLCLAYCSLFSSQFIPGLHSILSFRYYTTGGPLFHLFTAMFFITVPYSFYYLIGAYRKTSGREKLSLRYVILATVIGFTAGGTTFLQLYYIPFPFEFILIMPIYPFLMSIALIRHGLFDDEVLAQAAHRDKLAAIGTIATSINHEIRNPLYIIHGMAESFLHNFRNEEKNLLTVKNESVAVFEKTTYQAKRAMEIMSQLSMFAKQKISDEVDNDSANIQECLDNILPLVRHEMTLDKVTFENHLPCDLPGIKANPRQIEEVLFNLFVNSCQALKKESGIIKVTARCVAEKIIMAIEDNGLGISAAQLKKIFEPFYTTKEEGTGLGLYIVKQLVEKNGGMISVESQEGKGTRFVLEFPR